MSERFAYLLLEEEKWWNRRCNQRKAGNAPQAFVRRGKVGLLNAELLFYVKHPVREILGKAEFVERMAGTVDGLWSKYGIETVFESCDEYREFLTGREETIVIRFRNLQELGQPIAGKSFREKIGGGAMLPRNAGTLQRRRVC